MAKVPGHMIHGWLGWQQGLAKRQQGRWDGNRAWPHATKEAKMATGSGQMAPERLEWQHGLAGTATGPGHMAQG